jgi:arginine deiminase
MVFCKNNSYDTPANETFWEIIHPSAALYERPFSLQKAVAEHRRYIEALRNAGATVYTVVETLLRGTMNENGDPVPGKELNELRDFAK